MVVVKLSSLFFVLKSPSEVKPFTISTNNNIKQQDDELDFGNPYDRIHKYDDNKDFEVWNHQIKLTPV